MQPKEDKIVIIPDLGKSTFRREKLSTLEST
jgi:hypothetical protein